MFDLLLILLVEIRFEATRREWRSMEAKRRVLHPHRNLLRENLRGGKVCWSPRHCHLYPREKVNKEGEHDIEFRQLKCISFCPSNKTDQVFIVRCLWYPFLNTGHQIKMMVRLRRPNWMTNCTRWEENHQH